MDKPFTIVDNPHFDDVDKEKFIDFLIDWAKFYETVSYGGVHISAIVEKIGIPLREFEDRLEIDKSMNVYDCIKKVWIYSKRPLTIREICGLLGTKFSETNIRKQVAKLSRNGYLKQIKVKIVGKEIEFYYIPKEKKLID